MTESTKIIDLFDRAAKKLKWPHIRIQLDVDQFIKFSRAGGNSRYPGTINVTNGLPFNDGSIFYGRVQRDGSFQCHHTPEAQAMKEVVEKLLETPVEYCQINGKRYNVCCFCGSELTNANSVFYGYGPICAANWGLTWDDGSEREKENELIELINTSIREKS